MKIIVTGATGFIGQCVLNSFSKTNYEVVGLSRRKSTNPNILHINSYREIPEGDILIHLAESNDRFKVNKTGDSYVKEITKTARILTKMNFKRKVYISSVAVYPDNTVAYKIKRNKLNEESILTPFDFYSKGKLKCEKIFSQSSNSVTARISNIYGIGMSPHNVVSRIFSQLNNANQTIELFSSHPIRDFIFVEDVADAIKSISESKIEGTYNVGTGIGSSIKDLTNLILKINNRKNFKINCTNSSSNPSSIVLEVLKIHTDLKWKHKYSLEEGITKLSENLNPGLLLK